MTNDDFNLRGLRTLALAAVLAVVILIISLALLAASVDARARKRERSVVATELAHAIADLQDRVGTDANWNPAVLNLDNRFDPKWAQQNLTSATGADVTNRLVLVIDAANTIMFARDHAQPLAQADLAQARASVTGLVAQLRNREAANHTAGADTGRAATDWVTGHAIVLLHAHPVLFVASLVAPDSAAAALHHPRAPILLYGSDMRATVLPSLAGRLLLNHAAIETGAVRPPRIGLPLTSADGQYLGALSWDPERPGSNLMLGALPALLIIVSALAGAILIAYRQGIRGARALRASEAKAYQLAFHDGLTGLPNRTLFNDRIEQAVSHASRHGGSIAVLMIDMDRFKLVNDTFGHPAGDELIKEVARRLAAICRAEDTCARLGGDEFVILTLAGAAADAASLADRLSRAFSEPVQLGTTLVYTAASIGISLGRDGEISATDLVRQADLALYKAKDQARCSYRFFEIEMDHALQNRRGIENDLRAALRDGTLEVAYQLQVDGDRPTGVEALARWNHPQRGPISPGFFVPLAEECGLIDTLGTFVLTHALSNCWRWKGLTTAVNISTAQFRLPHFLANLQALLAAAQVDPSAFELEITETVLMVDDGQLHETLAALRTMGFRLVLDDFGTGYSSLSYLGRFPIDKIKIDRSFISGLSTDEAALPIVRAIIALAEALGLAVIAEGVETDAQRSALAALGCTAVQGQLTGHPGPASAIAASLDRAVRTRL